MKYNKVVACSVVVILMISACSGLGLSQETEGIIKIGMPHPVTGPIAFLGKQTIQGAKLAAKFINEDGGVMGRKIKIVVEDGKCRPGEAVTAMKKLKREGIKFFFGGLCSSATLAMMPLVKDGSGIIVSSSSSAPTIPVKSGIGGNEYVFTERVNDRVRTSIITRYILDEGNKTLSILSVDNDYGREAARVARETFKKLGGKVLSLEYFDEGESHYLPMLTKIKGLNPDALLICAYIEDGTKIVTQAHEIELWEMIDTYSVADMLTPEAWDVLGEGDVEKGMKLQEGLAEAHAWSKFYDAPENKKFMSAYKKEYGEGPADNSGQAFVVVYTFARAIEMALGQTGKADVETVKEALKRVQFDSGIMGSVYFDLYNHKPATLFLTEIEEGKLRFVKRYEAQLISWGK